MFLCMCTCTCYICFHVHHGWVSHMDVCFPAYICALMCVCRLAHMCVCVWSRENEVIATCNILSHLSYQVFSNMF